MNPPRILVVEDEQIVAASLSKRLTNLVYEMAGSAASGEQAVGHHSPLAATVHTRLYDV